MTNQNSEEKEKGKVDLGNEAAEAEQAQSGAAAEATGTEESAEATEPMSDLDLDQALARLEEKEAEAAKARDDVLRVQAEMQNLRRRAEQDVEKAHKFGQEKFAGELLSVIDNLERALEAATDHDDERVKAIYDGVNLTLKSFKDLFDKFAIETIDPLGEPFDPQRHQAMSTQENGEVEPNTVTAVLQKGYLLHDRVLRPAMVMVSKAPSGQ